jgi:hypothetical protein
MTAVDVGGAFDLPPRSADVRRIDSGRGRYNVANIGLFVWRLAWFGADSQAAIVGPNRYTFDPFGSDVPLVNPPTAAAATFTLLDRVNLPFFLQRYPLYTGLQSYASQPPAGVAVNGTALDPDVIGWSDLSDWTPPTASGINVAVDPVLGRLVFATAPAVTDVVTVTYTYAFSGGYGGGPYTQAVAADEATLEAQLAVTPVPSFATADLSAAANEVAEIGDSGIYPGNLVLSPDPHLLVIKAGESQRPVVAGNLGITGVAGARVTLRGLGIAGSLVISGDGPITVRLEHCTVRGTIDWSAAISGTLVIDHSLCGGVQANPDVDVSISDSAVDAGSDTAPALSAGAGAAAGSITVTSSTILGTVAARTIPMLANSIVTGTVVSTEQQAGCVRYSFVPAGSQTPQRFRCQPDLETDTEVAAARAANPALSPVQATAIGNSVQAWLMPAFTSRTAGQPGYLQLADAAPGQIRSGAEDGDEMGVFYGLFSGRRESNLTYRLNEYLRIGLEAGIIHAS